MAKKPNGPQMIVANRLTDGRALFLTSEGWATEPSRAAVAEDEAALDRLVAIADADVRANLVVAVEIVAAEIGAAGVRPAHIKYRMQATGPSVRPDLCPPGAFAASSAPSPSSSPSQDH